jgi:hypothetical protein
VRKVLTISFLIVDVLSIRIPSLTRASEGQTVQLDETHRREVAQPA